MKPFATVCLPLLAGLIAAVGCTTVSSDGAGDYPTQRALIGKTKQELLACAGAPVSEHAGGDRVLLVYYKEASQLEESFAGSKSSFAKVHHGCRAMIMFLQDRISEVWYESEPSSYQAQDHCEEIFEPCVHP